MQSGIAYNCVFSAIAGNETNKTYVVSACLNTYWASAREPHYDWIMFDLRSASPFVFLSPDRHWR